MELIIKEISAVGKLCVDSARENNPTSLTL